MRIPESQSRRHSDLFRIDDDEEGEEEAEAQDAWRRDNNTNHDLP